MSTPQLRPLRVGEILDVAITIYRRNAKTLLTLVLVVVEAALVGLAAMVLVFIAGSVWEAERAEAALTSAAVAYCLEAEDFTQGILSSRRTGVGFYVIEGQAARARNQLVKAELKSGIIEANP
mgnify:CR=1 FL=1